MPPVMRACCFYVPHPRMVDRSSPWGRISGVGGGDAAWFNVTLVARCGADWPGADHTSAPVEATTSYHAHREAAKMRANDAGVALPGASAQIRWHRVAR